MGFAEEGLDDGLDDRRWGAPPANPQMVFNIFADFGETVLAADLIEARGPF